MNKDQIDVTLGAWICNNGQAKVVLGRIAVHSRRMRGIGAEKTKLVKPRSQVELAKGELKHLPWSLLSRAKKRELQARDTMYDLRRELRIRKQNKNWLCTV
jgi:hypothetical protein